MPEHDDDLESEVTDDAEVERDSFPKTSDDFEADDDEADESDLEIDTDDTEL